MEKTLRFSYKTGFTSREFDEQRKENSIWLEFQTLLNNSDSRGLRAPKTVKTHFHTLVLERRFSTMRSQPTEVCFKLASLKHSFFQNVLFLVKSQVSS